MITAKHIFEELHSSMKDFYKEYHRYSQSPFETKSLRTFQQKEVEEMTGKSRQSIHRMAKEGIITPTRVPRGSVEYNEYDLSQVNKIREQDKTLPRRADSDECISLLIQNFKGGSAKTTVAYNLSTAYALKGYRVAVVDCDPQASITALLCGSSPDDFCTLEETIFHYIDGQLETMKPLIKKTHIEGLDLIPSCSRLTMLDALAGLNIAKLDEDETIIEFYHALQEGINSIKPDYDIIIIDSSPTLGFISAMCLISADAQIIPCPPNNIDLSSTMEYLSMASEVLRNFCPDKKYKFISFLATKYSSNNANNEILEAMRALFGREHMLDSVFSHRAGVASLANSFLSIPEAPPTKEYLPLKRNVSEIAHEIEKLIWFNWPSKAGQQTTQMIL